MDRSREKDVMWHRSNVNTERQLYSLVRKVANKLGWDPDFVESLVKEHGFYWTSPTGEIGWSIDWWEDGDLTLYMFTKF